MGRRIYLVAVLAKGPERLKADGAAAERRTKRWRQTRLHSKIEVARRCSLLRSISKQALLRPASEVHVQVLGPVQVLLNGEPISERHRKAKEMLALLLEARISRRDEVGLLELCDALYPEMSEKKSRLGPQAVGLSAAFGVGSRSGATDSRRLCAGSRQLGRRSLP